MLVERLRELREERGLTQVQLAELAGLNEMTVTRLEAGQRMPRQRTLQRLAQALGTTEDFLMGADEREHNLAALAECLPLIANEDLARLVDLARRFARDGRKV